MSATDLTPIKAVVMAGGEGSRLRPITAHRPKPLVPIGNQPIMEHIIGLLKRHGIEEIVATIHYLADEIQSYFDDGADFDVRMHYSVEDTPLGTAGSVKKAEALLRGGTFIIVSGDALTDCDLTQALEFHRSKKSLATLILYRVPNPLEFGVVITDEEGRIQRFLEKPSWSEVFSDTVNTGMYILEPEVFDTMEPGKIYDWSQDIFPRLLQEGKPLYGYVMDGYWCDVGNLTQYRDAQEHLLRGEAHLPVQGIERSEGVWVGANSVIEEGVTLAPPLLIGRNCKIKSGARIGPYTVIGDNSLVETGALVERSVVWDSSYIGAQAAVHSAIIGSKVTIKRDCLIQEDAVIGDRCLLDAGAHVRPRIKLWPDKVIERGSTVTMSLVWGNKWRGSLFRELGVAGLSNIEITPDFATRFGSAYGSTLPNGSKIVTSRDSTRSSRMIKRAIIASLLSVGCDVLDLRGTAVPIVRHFTKLSGAAGAVHTRKLPGNKRVTLMELFGPNGAYLPRAMERKVETAFFREDFHRTDPDDLGSIEYAGRAVEEYQAAFFHLLEPQIGGRKLKVVCDYGYSALGAIFPAMLARLGIESISLNGFSDAKLAPRSPEEVAVHLQNLKQIVGMLGHDLGVLFMDEGERMTVVDRRGEVVSGHELLAVLGVLLSQVQPSARISLRVSAPTKLEELLVSKGAQVLRTKEDLRSLIQTSLDATVDFGGDDRGGLLFPAFHAGFDAMFGLARLLVLLQATELSLTEVAESIPPMPLAYQQVRCPWESKGAVMRQITERLNEPEDVELLDGIKTHGPDGWVLVLPDSVEPVFHVYAEGNEAARGVEMLQQAVAEIENLVAKLAE